ncbi:MAG: type II toxin-antitoxin system HicB family antitoxin [Vulcanimicrobiaceae bacterium]
MKTVAVRIDYDSDTKTYGATSEDLPNVYAISDNREDVLHRFIRSATAYLEYLREENQPLPETLETQHEFVTVAIEAA